MLRRTSLLLFRFYYSKEKVEHTRKQSTIVEHRSSQEPSKESVDEQLPEVPQSDQVRYLGYSETLEKRTKNTIAIEPSTKAVITAFHCWVKTCH